MGNKKMGNNDFDITILTSRDYIKELSKESSEQSFNGKGKASFKKWKDSSLAWMSEIFSRYDSNNDYGIPQYIIVKEEDWFGCRRIDLVYNNPAYELNVPATILQPPEDKRNGAAILCQHGHGDWGRLSIIKDPVVPRDCMEIADFKYDFGLPIAQSGYTIIAIDLLGFGQRTEPRKELKKIKGRDPCDALGLFMMLYGRNLVAQQVSDMRFALSILGSWDNVDPKRIGMAGISQGARMTMFAAALDSRLKAVVAAGSNTFEDRTRRMGGLCGAQIIPGIMPQMDVYDIFSTIAPRPLQLQLGDKDPIIDHEIADRGISHIRKCYREAGEPENISIEHFDGGHEFRLDPALEWFDKWLKE